MKKAFGLLDLLLGLVIISFLFMISMNVFKSSVNINGSPDSKSIQKQVNEQVNEIENLRLENIKLQNEMLK